MSRVLIQYRDTYDVNGKKETLTKEISLRIQESVNGTATFKISEEALNDLIWIARSRGIDISLRDL
jgi:hypothetical protein